MMVRGYESQVPPESDAVAEGLRIVKAARDRDLEVYLFGGVAVAVCAATRGDVLFTREFHDLDVVVSRAAAKRITEFLGTLGYMAAHEFNAINGRTRLQFRDEWNKRDLDVLVGVFEMCHVLPVLERATMADATIPPSDLLLSKLQVVEMNRKDVLDVYNLLYACELSDGRDGDRGGIIDRNRVACLCAADWGLWRTVTRNLERVVQEPYRPAGDPAATERVGQQIEVLRDSIAQAKKSRRWQLRSRIGERVRWYEEPEEPN